MSAFPEIKHQCSGRWASVLVSLGMNEQIFNGKHGPCLFCNAGKDRARWVRQKEFYICNQCGSHNGIELAIHHLGLPFKEAANEIRRIIGNVKMEVVKTSDETEKNRARIERIRQGLKPINGECAASRYLANRGLKVLPDKDCYFHPGVEHWQDGVKTVHPAMVSIFRNVEGKGSTLHITYLTPDGRKANVEAPKKMLPVILPLPGCAIKLFEPINGVLAVAEGIETALAIHQMDDLPVWACGNASQMAALDVPDSVNRVLIYADEDRNYTGAKAAYALANRLATKGKDVKVMRLIDRQPIADFEVKSFDFLDYCVAEAYRQSGRNVHRSQMH
jgi:putative DNA primase/helicase